MGIMTTHLAAIESGAVTKTNVIGIRKAINAMERDRNGYSLSATAPKTTIEEVFAVEEKLSEREPNVTGEFFLSGLAVLTNPRYAKRFSEREHAVIDDIDVIKLVRFDRIGRRGEYAVPVFRAKGCNGDDFLYWNIPWQSGGRGPEIVEEE